MNLRHAILMAAAFTLAACAYTPREDDYRLALADHGTCVDRGYEFPSNRYDGCRYELAERRHQRDWQNLNMARMPRINQGVEHHRPAEVYRPLSREAFRCTARETHDGTAWIHCDMAALR